MKNPFRTHYGVYSLSGLWYIQYRKLWQRRWHTLFDMTWPICEPYMYHSKEAAIRGLEEMRGFEL